MILNFYNICQKYGLKFLGKVKMIKAPAGFELITYRSLVYTLTHCSTLWNNYSGKEKKFIKLYLNLIFHFNRRYVTTLKCFISLKNNCFEYCGLISATILLLANCKKLIKKIASLNLLSLIKINMIP